MSGGQVVQYRFTPTCVGKMDRPPGGLRRAGRFTPTCVGKMTWPWYTKGDAAVHPHVRGENIPAPIPSIRTYGSPPRAWGKYKWIGNFSRYNRFTPTRVGKMLGIAACCGLICGSPPHAWGKFTPNEFRQSSGRFTPTRVGKIAP